MFLLNKHPDYRRSLEPNDAVTLGLDAAREVERFLQNRVDHKPTPLLSLPSVAAELGVASVHIKDESKRLGLGSFKALGGSYAVIRLVLKKAAHELGRSVDVGELQNNAVRQITSRMTFACATDGNHGRSVAMGAQLVGAKCSIFVHSGVSDERIAAIAHYGAEIIRVEGNYDDSVDKANRVAKLKDWVIVSDTSWPGYEEIPGLVMQGYTALLSESVRGLPHPPTHVFVQAGVGGIAATVAGHFSLVFGDKRPFFTVVDPSRAACLFESARAGRPVKVQHSEPTIMAMLECYEPSLIAWRILSRAADAFMTIEDSEAVEVMRKLANPSNSDPAIVAGESGGVGLAALCNIASKEGLREQVGLGVDSHVFLINTEGATDIQLYEKIVGLTPQEVESKNQAH
jgi:diaminopropionate ammonia-lyase